MGAWKPLFVLARGGGGVTPREWNGGCEAGIALVGPAPFFKISKERAPKALNQVTAAWRVYPIIAISRAFSPGSEGREIASASSSSAAML